MISTNTPDTPTSSARTTPGEVGASPVIPRPRMATTAKRETRVVVECVCGRSHRLRNINVYTTVIQAFLDGELMRVTPNGIAIDCVMTVLNATDEVER